MDPFDPIRVDQPESGHPQSQPPRPLAPEPGAPHGRPDAADASMGAAQTLLVLNAIDQRTDAAVAGAAEVAGAPGPVDDPFDEPARDRDSADGGDGCGPAVLAVLLALTAAAGSAAAFVR